MTLINANPVVYESNVTTLRFPVATDTDNAVIDPFDNEEIFGTTGHFPSSSIHFSL
jgi:hypothetical protein